MLGVRNVTGAASRRDSRLRGLPPRPCHRRASLNLERKRQIRAFAATVSSRAPRLDILVNNAGTTILEAHTPEGVGRIAQINFLDPPRSPASSKHLFRRCGPLRRRVHRPRLLRHRYASIPRPFPSPRGPRLVRRHETRQRHLRARVPAPMGGARGSIERGRPGRGTPTVGQRRRARRWACFRHLRLPEDGAATSSPRRSRRSTPSRGAPPCGKKIRRGRRRDASRRGRMMTTPASTTRGGSARFGTRAHLVTRARRPPRRVARRGSRGTLRGVR